VKKQESLAAILFLTWVAGIFAAPLQQPELVDGGHYDCFRISTFGLKGILLGRSYNSVINSLGKPKNIDKGFAEDDGGGYDIYIYKYKDIAIEMVRGVVDKIYTNSPSVNSPGGLRVGDTFNQVIKKLGRVPKGWENKAEYYSIGTCPVKGRWVQDDYVMYKFDNQNRLTEISFEANRP